jgi:hypothetical protein
MNVIFRLKYFVLVDKNPFRKGQRYVRQFLSCRLNSGMTYLLNELSFK